MFVVTLTDTSSVLPPPHILLYPPSEMYENYWLNYFAEYRQLLIDTSGKCEYNLHNDRVEPLLYLLVGHFFPHPYNIM